MKKIICILFILIFFPIFLNAAEIEILSDIPGTGPTIVNHSKISVHRKIPGNMCGLQFFLFEQYLEVSPLKPG